MRRRMGLIGARDSQDRAEGPPDVPAAAPRPPRNRRWVITRIVVPAAALAAVGITLGLVATGGSDVTAADSQGSAATATVSTRDLVDRETFSGTLGYGNTRDVVNNQQGTVTRVTKEGAVRKRGQILYRVNGEPVVLLYGSVPAYRALSQGDEGDDVRQLERNLVDLGFDDDGDVDVDGDFDAATTRAVEDWQDALGVDQTGSVALGQVVFLNGVRRIGTITGNVGSGVRAGQVVMQTTSTQRTVTVQLDARRQDLVKVGDVEKVTLPGSTTVNATVTDVGTVAKAATEDADPSITVTLTLDSAKGVTALDEAPVDVDIAKERRKGVLTVPVTALLALSGGGYGLEIQEADATKIVSVKVGLFADGYVEVSGSGIAEGVKVVVPS